MFGGFRCFRNSLIGLNVFYIAVGIALITLGSHLSSSNTNKVSSLPIIGGVVACGVFLLILSVLGIFGALKHHQVILFFYMVILFVLFLIQFSIGCACLAVSDSAQRQLANQGWASLNNDTKKDVQKYYECCSFDEKSRNSTDHMMHPSCSTIDKCIPQDHTCRANDSCCSTQDNCVCSTCLEQLQPIIDRAFKLTGYVSLFFCFTEFLGVWLTYRFRNQKDPLGGNPSAFL